MFILVDEREVVTHAYNKSFEREGIPAVGFAPPEFLDWVSQVKGEDAASIEAFIFGESPERAECLRAARSVSRRTPVIALSDMPSLERTLELFSAGMDDVVRKPVHVRELLARAGAIRRRWQQQDGEEVKRLRVFFDGRDPEVNGAVLPLPRRERRILEYLVQNNGKRITKSQIYSAVYGLFNEGVDENVVESHISKLRKKLRDAMGFDPIESRRFLGYMLKLD